VPQTEKVTEAQAAEALRALIADGSESDEPQAAVEAAPEPAAAPTEPEPPAAGATAEQPTEVAVAEPTPPDGDDVTSLKKRLDERDAQVKQAEEQFNARIKASQERYQQNENILRNRFLRKATVADKALRILKATRTESGVPEADVDSAIREIESTMNPASSTYVPPEPASIATEDQAIVLNSFLNEKGMTTPEADEFGKWIRSDGATILSEREQDLARRDLDGFLRVAHTRYLDGMREKDKQTRRNDAVEAVRSVQRVQKEAARAASAPAAAPKKQPTAPKPGTVDWAKMSKAEQKDMVGKLLRQSVEQYH
jgi:hypothetical protein